MRYPEQKKNSYAQHAIHIWSSEITCESQNPSGLKSHVIFFHVKFHMWPLKCEISHFTCFSHVAFHMWNSTCEMSHAIFQMRLSQVTFHMLLPSWYFSHVESHLWNITCEKCHVKLYKIHIWLLTWDFSQSCLLNKCYFLFILYRNTYSMFDLSEGGVTHLALTEFIWLSWNIVLTEPDPHWKDAIHMHPRLLYLMLQSTKLWLSKYQSQSRLHVFIN